MQSRSSYTKITKENDLDFGFHIFFDDCQNRPRHSKAIIEKTKLKFHQQNSPCRLCTCTFFFLQILIGNLREPRPALPVQLHWYRYRISWFGLWPSDHERLQKFYMTESKNSFTCTLPRVLSMPRTTETFWKEVNIIHVYHFMVVHLSMECLPLLSKHNLWN